MTFKIALFTNQFPAKVSTFFSRDVYNLVQQGFQVDIFPIYPIRQSYWIYIPQHYREVIQNNTKVIFVSPFRFQARRNGIPGETKYILSQSRRYGFSQFLKSCYVVHQSQRWSRLFDGRYDYLLSYWGNYAATYAYLANQASTKKKPFSLFLHAGTDLYRDQIFLEQKILSAQKIFTVCEFNIRYLQQLYPRAFEQFQSRLVLYHLGIDLKEFEFVADERDDNSLLAIGSLFSSKGFVFIIEALAQLRVQFPRLKLIIIGDGPEKRTLAKRASKLGISEKVVFTGHLPSEEVKKFLRQSTILVHPSSELGDAVPTVIKEALASGLPVIASEIAGIPELLSYGNAGVLVKPKDPFLLANSIRRLLLDQQLRRTLAQAGRDFAEQNFDMLKNSAVLFEQLRFDLRQAPDR